MEQIYDTEHELSKWGYQVLLHWKQENGSAATYQALCDALEHFSVRRRDLAEEYCYQYIDGKYLFFCYTEWWKFGGVMFSVMDSRSRSLLFSELNMSYCF